MEKYECINCKRTETVEDQDKQPKCCGKPMKKIPYNEICLQPSHPEHARPTERDEACDEGRAGT